MAPLTPNFVSLSSRRMKSQIYNMPSEACRCGYVTRKFTFRSIGIDHWCFYIYSWLLADPRVPECTHQSMLGEDIPQSQALDAVCF